MKANKIPAILFGFILLAGAAVAQTEKPLKRDPLRSFQTVMLNVITESALVLEMQPMVDPRIDDGSSAFSYFAKPVYQIGLPSQHFATMVTPEGRLFNGFAELVFFGKGMKPLDQRLYTLLDGWLPCIQYQVERDGLVYKVEAFQFWLESEFSGPPVNFVRFTATNPGSKSAKAGLAIGSKFGTRDHRPPGMRQGKFNPLWSYSMTDKYAERSGNLIYYFDEPPARKWSMQGAKYSKGRFKVFESWRVNSIAEYEFELAPGESKSLQFKFPQKPAPADAWLLQKMAAADFAAYLNKMAVFWALQVNSGMTINLSEKKVVNASRAALVHNIMSQDYPSDNEILQTVNRFQYNRFWLRDGAFFARMYAVWGHLETSQNLLRHFLRYQDPSGNFISQKGQLDGFGQSLWAFGEYIKVTGDRGFAEEILPAVKKSVKWFAEATAKDEYGLMPPTTAMDNEWIVGRYTGHNFWALAGIDGAIAVARSAGDESAAGDFEKLRKKFADNLYQRVHEAAKMNKGRIPPGMDVPDGVDWGNLFEVYPSDFMSPDDPLVVNIFDHYRKHHFKEGVATYHQSMHHYVTERLSEMSIRQGRQEEALSDLYSMLMHTGSCHQGFEWSMFPWSNRDYCFEAPGIQSCNFPPHGWYAALYNTLLRNMLVREQGDELHLLSVVSPEWVGNGDELSVSRAPTYFGAVSFSAVSGPLALKLSLNPDFENPPKTIVVHFPFFAKVSQVTADGNKVDFNADGVRLEPGVKSVEISWRLNPEPKYSYQSFVDEYRREYAEKFHAQNR